MIRRRLLAAPGLLLAGRAFAAPATKPRVAVRTDHGDFMLEIEAAKAPITATNFLRYVDAGKYDGGTFFRTTKPPGAPGEGTLVGGANPRAHPYPPIAHESTAQTGLKHGPGTISLGRFAPGSATSDIFICMNAIPNYDAHAGKGDTLGYAVFGAVAQGMDVVRRIHALPAHGKSPFADQKGQWLTKPVTILSMRRA